MFLKYSTRRPRGCEGTNKCVGRVDEKEPEPLPESVEGPRPLAVLELTRPWRSVLRSRGTCPPRRLARRPPPRRRDRGDHVRVTGTKLLLGAVVHPDVQPARYVVAGVQHLAAIRTRYGLDVLRPPPAGLEHEARGGEVAEANDTYLAVIEGPGLVGGVRALPLETLRGYSLLPPFPKR